MQMCNAELHIFAPLLFLLQVSWPLEDFLIDDATFDQGVGKTITVGRGAEPPAFK
jgi:hypothetical protein